MGSVYVGICHNNNAMVAKFFGINGITYAHAQSDGENLKLFEGDDLIKLGSFGV